jgi:hypothetical protein
MQIKIKEKKMKKQKEKICIVPTYENILLSYARIYSSMTEGGKKQIELELSRIGVALDSIEKINPIFKSDKKRGK